MMKNYLVVVFVTFAICGFAQELRRTNFGVTAAVGGSIVHTGSDFVGGLDITGKTSYELGANYYHNITKRFALETGIIWHYNQISVRPMIYPGIDRTPTYHDLNLLYVPAFVRAYISNAIFINGGILLDLDVSKGDVIESQSGLGMGFGLGGEIAVSEKILLQVNPFFNMHGLTQTSDYKQRLYDLGLRVGIKSH